MPLCSPVGPQVRRGSGVSSQLVEKLSQKETEVKEDQRKYQAMKQEFERVLREGQDRETQLVEATEKLQVQGSKLGILEESLSRKSVEHEKVSERLRYAALSSDKLQSELDEVKGRQREAMRKVEDSQKAALKNQYVAHFPLSLSSLSFPPAPSATFRSL